MQLRVKKSPLNDGRFITGRNFWNEQALSADIIYNDAVYTQRSKENNSTGNQIQR